VDKVTLEIAAKYAQYMNFDGTLDTLGREPQVLAGRCSSVGTDFAAIGRSSNYQVAIGSTEEEVSDRLAWIRDHPTAVVGAGKPRRKCLVCRPAGGRHARADRRELSTLKAAGRCTPSAISRT
jgi:hypothetical protein